MPYWHVTPTENLPGILRDGLMPQVGPRSSDLGEEEPAVYLFTDLASVETALSNWLGEWFEDEPEEARLALIEVTLPADARFAEGAGFEIVVLEPIPAEAIRVVTDDIDHAVGSFEAWVLARLQDVVPVQMSPAP